MSKKTIRALIEGFSCETDVGSDTYVIFNSDYSSLVDVIVDYIEKTTDSAILKDRDKKK